VAKGSNFVGSAAVTSRRTAVARLLASACGLASLAGACGAHSPGGNDEVRIGYMANMTHAQALLGVYSGELAQAVAPARLVTRVFNAGPSVIEALFAGEIDIGYVGPSPALNAHLKSRGKGIRVIAGSAANGAVIVARKDSGIETLADLKGRRIATPQIGNTQDVSARHYVTKVLGQSNAENVIPVPNAEQALMMARGEIDAAWTVEPWGAALTAGSNARLLAQEKDLWPGGRLSLTLVVVDPGFLQLHPAIVERVLECHVRWTDRLSDDSAALVPTLTAALVSVTGRSLPEAVIADGLSRVLFTDDPIPESLEVFARWAYELGRARGISKVSTLVDDTPLATAKKRSRPAGVQGTPTK